MRPNNLTRTILLAAFLLSNLWTGVRPLAAEEIVLDDGRSYSGKLLILDGVAENPAAKAAPRNVDVKRIQMIDNGLTRTFVPKRRIVDVRQPIAAGQVRLNIRQRIVKTGPRMGTVGPIIKVTPFDAFGRRTFSMKANTPRGRLDVIQGITEITPLWTKVESVLSAPPRPGQVPIKQIIWEMYVATSSIPRDTLSKVLHRAINKDKLHDRLEIVRLYIEADRYNDAKKELEQVIVDFPKQKGFERQVLSLRQKTANRLLLEVTTRENAGQYKFAHKILTKFPTKNVAGAVLGQVKLRLDRYDKIGRSWIALRDYLDAHYTSLPAGEEKTRVEAVLKEIKAGLYMNNYDRLTTYRLKSDDAAVPVMDRLSPRKKLALAISGWLIGSDNAIDNLAEALSLYETRELVRKYLRSKEVFRHKDILRLLEKEEGATPRYVSLLLTHMKPPLDAGQPDARGLHTHNVATVGAERNIDYLVSLPPEYDPHRRYPTIITLHGAGTTAEQQIDWWAGSVEKTKSTAKTGVKTTTVQRRGQATRHGYIVIAPKWGKVAQKDYEASAREHAAVLNTLRDAGRRFAIDTDRVYLSGHSMGGSAAWEIGVSHPDLWAGVMPIVADTSGMVKLYSQNAQLLPMYFIAGERDGTRMLDNARDLNRYLRKNYDTTVVEYRGRGHEHFHEDIHNLFDWMGRKKRDFYPSKFAAVGKRSWDNYYYWVEVSDMPAKLRLPAKTSGKINVTRDGVTVRSAARRVSIWLTPQLVDFDKNIRIKINGIRIAAPTPSVSVMLEDVRTRGDRLHPFWARADSWLDRARASGPKKKIRAAAKFRAAAK